MLNVCLSQNSLSINLNVLCPFEVPYDRGALSILPLNAPPAPEPFHAAHYRNVLDCKSIARRLPNTCNVPTTTPNH